MPLNLYRRHHPTNCKTADLFQKLTGAAKAKALRHYIDCDCPIWIEGRTATGELVPRTSLTARLKHDGSDIKTDGRDWKAAEAYVKSKDADTKDKAVHGPTIADCITRYIDSIRHKTKQRTISGYEQLLPVLQKYAADKNLMFVRELTGDMLEDFKVYGLAHLVDSSKKSAVKSIKAFLKVAYQRGWTTEALHIKVTSHQAVTEPKTPYTPDEVERLLRTAETMADRSDYGSDGHRFRLLMELMLETGMRCGDAVRFNPANCKKSVHLWKYTFVPQKTQKMKAQKLVTVFLSEGLKQSIALCNWMSPVYPFAHGVVDHADESRDTTTKMRAQVWSRMHDSIGPRCTNQDGTPNPVDDCRPHRLRDTFAVRLLIAGVLIEDVSRLLGHASVTMTETYYAAWVPERELLLENRLANALRVPVAPIQAVAMAA